LIRLVPFAQRRPTFADERHRDTPRAVAPERHRHAGQSQRRNRQRRGWQEDAPVEIAVAEVLALGRHAGLGHLRVEDHANGRRLGPHRERRPEVANHRGDDVALPHLSLGCRLRAPCVAVGRAVVRRAAAQPHGGAIDRFLPERSKTLALKRVGAEPHLAAEKERLEAVVGGAREDHAAEDLEAFLAV
jgi:hypothetical protein